MLATGKARSNPGKLLKKMRNRLGMTIRNVEDCSHRIARMEGNGEFSMSDTFLTEIENNGAIPSMHKLFSLSVIYRMRFADLLALYGVDPEKTIELPSGETPPQ